MNSNQIINEEQQSQIQTLDSKLQNENNDKNNFIFEQFIFYSCRDSLFWIECGMFIYIYLFSSLLKERYRLNPNPQKVLFLLKTFFHQNAEFLLCKSDFNINIHPV